MAMTGSSLAIQLPLIGGFTKGRAGYKQTKYTLHHAAAYNSVESIFNALKAAKISATYGVSEDKIAQYVDEKDRPWTSSNAVNDNQAITFEISNSDAIKAPTYAEMLKKGEQLGWPVSDKTIETVIKLLVDCMKRNGSPPLVVGETLTWHSMFAATVCPGPYLMSKFQYIADRVNDQVFAKPTASGKLYGVVKQVIALSDETKAKAYATELNSLGEKNAYYKVIEIPK